MENFIFGIRPVIEAIKSGKNIDRILMKIDLGGDNIGELFDLIKEKGVTVRRVPVEKLNRVTHKNHQGVIAYLSTVVYQDLETLIPALFDQGKVPLLMILDGITDVRNFGAIARTCECAGVDALIIPDHGGVTITPDAIKTSAGALLTLPVCRVSHVLDVVRYLKDYDFMVIAATEKATEDYTEPDYNSPVAIIMGNEEKGISYRVMKECTHRVSIPQKGTIQSLNVSVAAGIMIYEVVRQRTARFTSK